MAPPMRWLLGAEAYRGLCFFVVLEAFLALGAALAGGYKILKINKQQETDNYKNNPNSPFSI